MAIPNSTYTEVLTASIDNYRDTLADNVMNNNVLLLYLKNNGNSDPADGGAKLLENLMYAENGTFSWFSGYETLSVESSDVLTSAQFDWKQANCNVTMSGLEETQNSGRSQMFNLVKSRIKVAEITLQNNISTALFNSNTENGGKAIGGLQHLVADLPTTGTVGGIDASAQTFWRNQYYDFSDNSVTASSTTIMNAMNIVNLRCQRGTEKVDLVIAGETYFTYYENALQAQQRFTQAGDGTAVGGFAGYKYKTASVFYDPGCSSTRMYMLNTKYLHFRPAKGKNFVVAKERTAINQDASITPLFWTGNLTCSNRARQGIIVA